MDLTATQRRIMAKLEDGQAHSREELRACLWDELGDPANLRFHMTNLRAKIKAHGLTISSERIEGVTYFRLTRRLAPSRE